MFEFDFEDLWDEELNPQLIGTWAYIGRQGRTTYKVCGTAEGHLRFEGPSASGALLTGLLEPVRGFSLQAELTNEALEDVGTIRLSFDKERKCIISKFQVLGKETWGNDIVSHRIDAPAEDDGGAKTGGPAAPPTLVPAAAAPPPPAAAPMRPPPPRQEERRPPPPRQEERRPPPQKAEPKVLKQEMPNPRMDQFQNMVTHDVTEASASPYANQVSELSVDVFGINMMVGLDNLLKKGKTGLSIMVKGSSLVGYVLFSRDEKKPEISVHYLVIHGHFRGRSCGCNLLKHVQEKCRNEEIPRMVATCRFDQLFYFLRVGFYFSSQPPPNLQVPSAEVMNGLHHIRFGIEHPLGKPASGLLGRPPSNHPMPQKSSGWSDLEKEFFQRTEGKYVVEEVAKLRREPSKERASIVIPTMEKRQEFHEQFCACFEAQDWPDVELVVVESYQRFSSPAVASLQRRMGKRVIHVKYQTDLKIGLKRNLGAHLATGNYIIHFDDDDLYAPCYVRSMVNGLKTRNLKALTLCSWYNCDTNSGVVSYTDPEDGSWGYEGIVYGFGFSYAYYRDVAIQFPFPHISMSEDNQFMSRLRRTFGDEKVGLMRDHEGICLHLMHGNNSSGCGSHRDVSLEEAARMKVCDLHKFAPHVESKGLRAISYLVWSCRGVSKEEAQWVLSIMKRFLSLSHVKTRIAQWAGFCSPAEIHKRVTDLLWQDVYPEIFMKLGLPVEGGLDILLSAMEVRFRDDPSLIKTWRDVQVLQGNEEAAQKIGRHLLALQSKQFDQVAVQ